ncbi:MAG: 23S rRNA (pseudouridine(1915)-N(3))-methyltransferase RlmH [Bacteroidales bacterium]|nr:23S rRNA (pseudouridine(1915)-N(3))-methyltransferase RlmH [Bacteroidales bacterium]MBD5206611.1 23S rRNA (pseudouridine(1915)-N(3))-methyltransferase RlmH [Bacteroidales bacterium]MBD5223272.1 23S rRNA (pseudouridine(1915)-N(3))-methyltransferase RlmH [Bacteroidales bacterium]
MEFILITIGKTKIDYVATGIKEYLNRLKRYIPFSLVELADIKSAKGVSENIQKQKEGAMILEKISPSDFVILLDEKGREYSSVEFANYLQKLMSIGRKAIVFVVGGPYGFSDDVYNRADAKLSLSRMTFNHEMIRLFFIEQVYRGMTILRGEPYHHE